MNKKQKNKPFIRKYSKPKSKKLRGGEENFSLNKPNVYDDDEMTDDLEITDLAIDDNLSYDLENVNMEIEDKGNTDMVDTDAYISPNNSDRNDNSFNNSQKEYYNKYNEVVNNIPNDNEEYNPKAIQSMEDNLSNEIYNQEIFYPSEGGKSKTRKSQKTRKNKKVKKYSKTGGNIDKLGDPDFNANLAYDSKKKGGYGVGFDYNDPTFSNDPSYSIYNTNELKLFPYLPTK